MVKQHLTATRLDITAGTPGKLVGYLINSHSSGTLKAWDNVVASGSEYLHNTITLAAGSGIVVLFPRPIPFVNGLSITVGGTIDAELFIEA